jgi:hypothetical protein
MENCYCANRVDIRMRIKFELFILHSHSSIFDSEFLFVKKWGYQSKNIRIVSVSVPFPVVHVSARCDDFRISICKTFKSIVFYEKFKGNTWVGPELLTIYSSGDTRVPNASHAYGKDEKFGSIPPLQCRSYLHALL